MQRRKTACSRQWRLINLAWFEVCIPTMSAQLGAAILVMPCALLASFPKTFGRGKGRQPGHGFPPDLHNLFPARGTVQVIRGEKPFREIPDAEAERWMWLDMETSTVPTSEIDEYSESSPVAFEPREDRKGDVARALLYVSTVYAGQVDPGFLEGQLADIQYWPSGDPPTPGELRRNLLVQRIQGNINPFALDEGLWSRLVGIAETIEPDHVPGESAGLDVFPVPATDLLQVQLRFPNGPWDVATVFDLLGRRVIELGSGASLNDAQSLTLDVSELPPSAYLVRVSGAGWSAGRLFLVAR